MIVGEICSPCPGGRNQPTKLPVTSTSWFASSKKLDWLFRPTGRAGTPRTRYPGGRGLETASVADAVRLITTYVHGDPSSEAAIVDGLGDGSIPAAISRLWTWYRQATVGGAEFVDYPEYAADGVYRWCYERTWAPGGTLCWIGLNPGTGDRDSGLRPTLQRVVGWARREGCAAVTVVNLFSYRSTDPKALPWGRGGHRWRPDRRHHSRL